MDAIPAIAAIRSDVSPLSAMARAAITHLLPDVDLQPICPLNTLT
jgi:hypothetical protein